MPVYQYRDRKGQVIELLRSVDERDQVPAGLRRILVPQRISVVPTGGTPNPMDADQAVPRAFRKLEEKIGSDALLREGNFSVKDIKEAWNFA